MATETTPAPVENRTPVEFLKCIFNDPTQPMQIRLESAKALLPYTAKKLAEALETTNKHLVLKDERLAELTDDELNAILATLRKIT